MIEIDGVKFETKEDIRRDVKDEGLQAQAITYDFYGGFNGKLRKKFEMDNSKVICEDAYCYFISSSKKNKGLLICKKGIIYDYFDSIGKYAWERRFYPVDSNGKTASCDYRLCSINEGELYTSDKSFGKCSVWFKERNDEEATKLLVFAKEANIKNKQKKIDELNKAIDNVKADIERVKAHGVLNE